ncbi:LysR family transcriptional regulator [Cohnella herbarum]|uniref:LysR family transcriptional regulator n=1 Tax=Cohnella herbarum TaxID=2728023 RepID=A0A7Z2VFA8_9BACL|nr:LysR family transcriptional regulator [Cohnella herbarum]QJD82067.1 LysR family transcriptional regulator [Cohnella herbarum]
MDIRAINTFHHVVRSGSFLRAAEQLNYSQSSVTMQIQKLESTLGLPLFDRSRRTVRLTDAGNLFYEKSLKILQDIEALQTSLIAVHSGESGSVRIGVVEPTASFRLPMIVKSFLANYPNIRISIEIAPTTVLCERIRKGDLDFAIGTPPLPGTDIHFEPIFEEPFVALMATEHPLAALEVITIADLQKHRLLITGENCPYRMKLGTILHDTGTDSLDTMEIGSISALKYYAQIGLGVALVPLIALCPMPEGTVYRQVNHKDIDLTCGMLCYSPDLKPNSACRIFYDFVLESLKSRIKYIEPLPEMSML